MDNLFIDLKRLKYFGVGAIIGKTVRFRRPEDTIIGDYSIIDDFAYISSALEVGRHCHIASHVSISGGAGRFMIGNYSTISNHCSIHCASSEYESVSLDLPSVSPEMRFGGEVRDVTLAEYVIVGAHSCILPGAFLPAGSAFGAYSLIKQADYTAFGLHVGIPAKFVKRRNLPNNVPAHIAAMAKFQPQ